MAGRARPQGAIVKRRPTLSPAGARNILNMCKASGDFHALGTDSVAALLEEARERRYRRPAGANGSTARSFHAYLVRVANRDG
jgi:hypothetical protein